MYIQGTAVLPEAGARLVKKARPDVRRSSHLGRTHPLASVARERCLAAGHYGAAKVGQTACGACWEAAIRADERVVVMFGLDAVAPAAGDVVDEIAVEMALAGKPVTLTDSDRAAAARALSEQGLEEGAIAYRLATNVDTVRHALSLSQTPAPVTAVKAVVACPSCAEPVQLSARGGEQRLLCGFCGRVFLSGDAQAWTGAAR